MVNKDFASLLAGPGHPAVRQRRARDLLPSALAQSNLHLWEPGMPGPDSGIRLLIGITTWSIPDLELLDYADEALDRSDGQTQVDVFNVDDCLRTEDLNRYIPEAGRMLQTPFLGVWQDGAVIWRECGYEARQLVKDYLGSSSPSECEG